MAVLAVLSRFDAKLALAGVVVLCCRVCLAYAQLRPSVQYGVAVAVGGVSALGRGVRRTG